MKLKDLIALTDSPVDIVVGLEVVETYDKGKSLKNKDLLENEVKSIGLDYGAFYISIKE